MCRLIQSVPTYRGEWVSPGCCHTGEIPEASFPYLEAPGCTVGLQARQPSPLIPPRPLLTSRLHLKVKLPSPVPSVLTWLCPWKEASSLWLQDPPCWSPPSTVCPPSAQPTYPTEHQLCARHLTGRRAEPHLGGALRAPHRGRRACPLPCQWQGDTGDMGTETRDLSLCPNTGH